MNEKRYFLKTTYNKDGEIIAKVMEKKDAYKEAVELEVFTHEWRAYKRIDELIKQAYARGEQVVFNPQYSDRFFNTISE